MWNDRWYFCMCVHVIAYKCVDTISLINQNKRETHVCQMSSGVYGLNTPANILGHEQAMRTIFFFHTFKSCMDH